MFDFLSRSFSTLFSGFSSSSIVSAKELDIACVKVEQTLLEADVPLSVVKQFVAEIKKSSEGKKITPGLKPSEYIMKMVYDTLVSFLGGATGDQAFSFSLPSTIMVLGLQGSGKTTTLAKLAYLVQHEAKKRGKERRILVASVDFYRPAAIDQLEVLAKNANISFYRSPLSDPIAAAVDIQSYAQKNSFELLFLDTAGRMHVDDAMLAELKSIDGRLKPKYKILVLDSMTGQQSLAVAKSFNEAVGFSGAVLSKMDSDTRGGAAFAFRYALSKPVLYVGIGEKIADIEPFRPERMASRMLGMGDVATLIERAEEKIKQAEQQSAYDALMSGKMTLQDFAKHIEMVGRLGSLGSLMKFLPGVGSVSINQEALDKGEVELQRFKVIINSMTPKERVNASIINKSRIKRIAAGAGVRPEDVSLLLSRFEQSQQFVKMFKKGGGFNRFFK